MDNKIIEMVEKALKDEKQRMTRGIFHSATPDHNPLKKKGKGYTRRNKKLSKSKLAIQKNSKRINRLKKRHHKTAKEKKSR